MEDDGDGRRDVGWKYAFLGDPNNKNDVTCKFCQKVAKGGIYRLKQHLAGGYRNIKACNKCPEHIRQEIIEYMAKKKSERDQMNLLHEPDKITDLEEEETEFFMANDPRGKRPMSAVVSQASVAKKARQVGPMDAFCTPKVVALQSGKQSTINEAYRKEQREKAAADVARWLYDAGIPFNALNYPSFKVAMDSVARAGIGQKPLSAYEARVPFLRKEVQRTNDLMKIHREEWARTGCSIMSDGWEDRCHRSILNFLVNCSKGSMFIESVDASSYSKTGDRLYMLLSRIIEKVGEHNVVQVITDNGSNFVAAGALLEAKYPHLYWTPCAAHCIDLMLEDISKISAIDRVLKRAIHMTSFIYQRPNLINLMRRFSGQRNLLRPAKTRFATAFITLSSIHKQRDNLRKLFTSQEWVTSKWAKELGGKRASQTVLMPTFWNGLVYALKLTGPLVHTLRLVDGERKPAMGYIYEAMDRTKEIIASTFNGNESKYIDVFQIIDNRWECQLHRPLHAAGHFLNPEFFYNNPQLEQCEEVVSGLYQCIQRLVPIIAKQDKIMEELTAYKNADGLFGNPMAIRHRKTKAPAEWWAAYGSSTPTLQQFAVKILSLTCSSSGCERNWSIFEHMISLCETPGADFNNKAFACGHVIILITAELPNVMDIFLAKLNRACIYTVPKHVMYSKSAFETREAYFIAIGYNEESGKLESEDDFIQRLGSYMRLYGALIQTEIEGVQNLHGLEEGWSWLARAVNSLPPGVYTAVAIEAFLRMAGFALHRRYLSQFRKLLSVVARKFAEVFETREDHKSVFRGLKSYIETSEFLMEPEGWRLHGSLISRSLHI